MHEDALIHDPQQALGPSGRGPRASPALAHQTRTLATTQATCDSLTLGHRLGAAVNPSSTWSTTTHRTTATGSPAGRLVGWTPPMRWPLIPSTPTLGPLDISRLTRTRASMRQPRVDRNMRVSSIGLDREASSSTAFFGKASG